MMTMSDEDGVDDDTDLASFIAGDDDEIELDDGGSDLSSMIAMSERERGSRWWLGNVSSCDDVAEQ
jgi:hypothetical protein